MAAGSLENAAGAAQAPFLPRREDPHSRASQAAEQAEAWGKAARLDLQLVVEGGEVSHNGCFGASIDSGCTASITRCRLEGNDPYAVYVKGGSDVCISACQLAFGSGRSGASHWAKRHQTKLELAGGCGPEGLCDGSGWWVGEGVCRRPT